MTIDKKKNFLINIFFIAVVFAIAYFAIKFLTVYLLPFAIGLLISVIAQKPVAYISKKTKIKTSIVAVSFVVIVYSFVCILLFVIGYTLYDQLLDLVKKLPDYIPTITAVFENLSTKTFALLDNIPGDIATLISDLPSKFISGAASYLAEFVPSLAAGMVKSFPKLLVSTIMTIVASCYIAKEYTNIVKFLRNVLPKKVVNVTSAVKRLFFENIFKIIRGYLILMVITFAILSLGLGIIGIDNFIFIAALIAIVDLFPVLGTGTVLIPWALIELVVYKNILMAVGIIVLYLVITVARNFLEPKIIGEQMGLHPLITLISLFCGLRLFGIIGMFGFPIGLMIITKLHKEGLITLWNTNNHAEE